MKNRRPVRDAALRLLSQREHTRAELAEKLSGRGYDRSEINLVIEEFVDRGFLSEARAALLFAEKALADRSYGLRHWHAKMLKRGFPDDLVSDMLEQIRREADEKANASELATALCRRGKTAEQIARTLSARGFAGESILDALRKLNLDICEPGS